MSSAAPIQLLHLTRTYGSGEALVHALRDVSLDIRTGEFLALAGPSGSGKSTLLNLIGCIDTPTSGTVLFDGRDLGQLSGRQRTRFRNDSVGFIFQDFNLVPVLTAAENVELPLQIQGRMGRTEIRDAVQGMLERVGLGDLAWRRPSQLSGGQQQRVAIARALVKRPRVLLADEPTANLDSTNAREILELMKDLNATLGTTCIFSTHDPLVMSYARRLVRLHDGAVESDTLPAGGVVPADGGGKAGDAAGVPVPPLGVPTGTRQTAPLPARTEEAEAARTHSAASNPGSGTPDPRSAQASLQSDPASPQSTQARPQSEPASPQSAQARPQSATPGFRPSRD